MRKFVCTMSIFLLCVSLLAACGTEYEYSTYISATSNSADSNIQMFAFWKGSYYNDLEAPQEYTVEFQGESYTGMYKDTREPYMHPYATHNYKGNDVMFSIRSDTGELTFLSFGSSAFYDREIYKADVAEPEITAIEIADRIVSEYIQPSEYIRSVSSEDYTVDEKGKTLGFTTYRILYVKEVCGIHTEDRIFISVTSKGTVKSVDFGQIGAFNNIHSQSISMDKLEAGIDTKLIELEQQTGMYMSTGYEICEHMLCYTPEQDLAVVSRVSVQWCSPDEKLSKRLLEMTTLLQ